MDLITFIEAIVVAIIIVGTVFCSVFSAKITVLESRVDSLEGILREFQKDARKNNNG